MRTLLNVPVRVEKRIVLVRAERKVNSVAACVLLVSEKILEKCSGDTYGGDNGSRAAAPSRENGKNTNKNVERSSP